MLSEPTHHTSTGWVWKIAEEARNGAWSSGRQTDHQRKHRALQGKKREWSPSGRVGKPSWGLWTWQGNLVLKAEKKWEIPKQRWVKKQLNRRVNTRRKRAMETHPHPLRNSKVLQEERPSTVHSSQGFWSPNTKMVNLMTKQIQEYHVLEKVALWIFGKSTDLWGHNGQHGPIYFTGKFQYWYCLTLGKWGQKFDGIWGLYRAAPSGEHEPWETSVNKFCGSVLRTDLEAGVGMRWGELYLVHD